MSEKEPSVWVDPPPSVCVLCGAPWPAVRSRCECGGFCTWGPAKGAKPSSWIDYEKGIPNPPPRKEQK